jgi:hypothetical protein
MKIGEESRITVGAASLGRAKVEAAMKKMSAGMEKAEARRVREREAVRRATSKDLKTIGDAIERLISREERVRAAIERLRSRPFDSNLSFVTDAGASGRGETLFTQNLSKRIQIAVPPYDNTWAWGTIHKNGVSASAGRVGVIAFSSQTDACAAGLTLCLTTDKPAQVSVRPFIRNNWEYQLQSAGFWSWAEARGGIDASAWVDGGMVAGVRRTTAFDRHSSSAAVRDRGEEIALASDLALGFPMVPGKIYGVSYGAWLEFDSWGGVGGEAGSHALSQGKVEFVVIERFE